MKIPNLLRKVFADGAMNAAFIPYRRASYEKRIRDLRRVSLTTLMSIFFGIIIGLLCIIVSLFPEPFILLSAPGFREKPARVCCGSEPDADSDLLCIFCILECTPCGSTAIKDAFYRSFMGAGIIKYFLYWGA